MVSQLQSVSTVDLYYICQVVDNVARSSMPYARSVDAIFGDMPSVTLTRSYPKWTCFHIFIEELVSSIIWEQADDTEPANSNLWVNHLLSANGLATALESVESVESVESGGERGLSAQEYIERLVESGAIEELCETLAKQVFHVLFSNRKTMSAFGKMVSGFVLNAAPTFAPEAFVGAGHLKRADPPVWAKDAVFHRDKGRCVLCKTDLTKLLSRQAAIHFDHIVPLAQGGMNCVTNLQLTCANCNLGKGARSATTSLQYESWYDY